MYEDIQIQEIKNNEWTLTIDKECQIYESIYDVIDKLGVLGFNATFRLPEEMHDVNPMDKCE
jgi:hypothetical protein